MPSDKSVALLKNSADDGSSKSQVRAKVRKQKEGKAANDCKQTDAADAVRHSAKHASTAKRMSEQSNLLSRNIEFLKHRKYNESEETMPTATTSERTPNGDDGWSGEDDDEKVREEKTHSCRDGQPRLTEEDSGNEDRKVVDCEQPKVVEQRKIVDGEQPKVVDDERRKMVDGDETEDEDDTVDDDNDHNHRRGRSETDEEEEEDEDAHEEASGRRRWEISSEFTRALQLFECEHEEWSEQEPAYSLLGTLLENIAKYPQEEKFRRFRSANAKITNKILSKTGGPQMCQAAGFVEDPDKGVWIAPTHDDRIFRWCRSALRAHSIEAFYNHLRRERDAAIEEEKSRGTRNYLKSLPKMKGPRGEERRRLLEQLEVDRLERESERRELPQVPLPELLRSESELRRSRKLRSSVPNLSDDTYAGRMTTTFKTITRGAYVPPERVVLQQSVSANTRSAVLVVGAADSAGSGEVASGHYFPSGTGTASRSYFVPSTPTAVSLTPAFPKTSPLAAAGSTPLASSESRAFPQPAFQSLPTTTITTNPPGATSTSGGVVMTARGVTGSKSVISPRAYGSPNLYDGRSHVIRSYSAGPGGRPYIPLSGSVRRDIRNPGDSYLTFKPRAMDTSPISTRKQYAAEPSPRTDTATEALTHSHTMGLASRYHTSASFFDIVARGLEGRNSSPRIATSPRIRAPSGSSAKRRAASSHATTSVTRSSARINHQNASSPLGFHRPYAYSTSPHHTYTSLPPCSVCNRQPSDQTSYGDFGRIGDSSVSPSAHRSGGYLAASSSTASSIGALPAMSSSREPQAFRPLVLPPQSLRPHTNVNLDATPNPIPTTTTFPVHQRWPRKTPGEGSREESTGRFVDSHSPQYSARGHSQLSGASRLRAASLRNVKFQTLHGNKVRVSYSSSYEELSTTKEDEIELYDRATLRKIFREIIHRNGRRRSRSPREVPNLLTTEGLASGDPSIFWSVYSIFGSVADGVQILAAEAECL